MMDLDEETRAALGWGVETESAPLTRDRTARNGPRTRRIGRKRDEVKFDGRSRQNWRRKRASATTAVSKSQGEAE